MGISADLNLIKVFESETPQLTCNDYVLEFNSLPKSIKDFYSDYKNPIVYTKSVLCLGSGSNFKKGVLDNYEDNGGRFTVEDGLKHLKEYKLEEIKVYFRDKFGYDIDYIDPNKFYIDLNY